MRNDESKKRAVSFAGKLAITRATRADWAYFARWHYRGHGIGRLKFATLLWHGQEPVGICVFTCPPLSLRPRNRFFGRSGKWERTSLQALNRQLVTLSRVVLHPTYRGAGIAAEFVRRSCELSGFRWVETLTQMGHINPFFEKAGFVRVGRCRPGGGSRAEHSAIYGGRKAGSPQVSAEAHRKSRYAEPVYYVWDGRSCRRGSL